MANRIVLGKANDGSSDVYGLWISKPAISGGFDGNVINGSGVLCNDEDMLFDSRKGKFASVLANQNGTGSVQSVTVPPGGGGEPVISSSSGYFSQSSASIYTDKFKIFARRYYRQNGTLDGFTTGTHTFYWAIFPVGEASVS